MKKYYNKQTNTWYREGECLTIYRDKKLFSGVPTEELLTEWGYEEYIEPTPQPVSEETKSYMERQRRMSEIQRELKATDYIAIKAFEGEDVSEYGDWKEKRKALRVEYNELEALQKAYVDSLNVE